MSHTEAERGRLNQTSRDNQESVSASEMNHSAEPEQSLSKFAIGLNTFALTGCAGMSGGLLAALFTQSLPIVAVAMIAGSIGGRYLIKKLD